MKPINFKSIIVASTVLLGLSILCFLGSPNAYAEHGAKETKDTEKALPTPNIESPGENGEELKPVTNPTMADLKAYYAKGNYRAVLAAADKMKPTMMTHYYKGLAHQGVNQNYKAAIEYNYVKNNALDKQLKYNATRALSSLYKQKKRANSTRWFRDKFIEDEYARYPEKGDNEGQFNRYEEGAFRRSMERARQRKIDYNNNKWRIKKPQMDNTNGL